MTIEPSHASHENVAPGASRMPVVFFPHGGGPWPFVDLGAPKAEVDALTAYLRSVRAVPRTPPRGLLVVSAHVLRLLRLSEGDLRAPVARAR
jgi:hypothetical protein